MGHPLVRKCFFKIILNDVNVKGSFLPLYPNHHFLFYLPYPEVRIKVNVFLSFWNVFMSTHVFVKYASISKVLSCYLYSASCSFVFIERCWGLHRAVNLCLWCWCPVWVPVDVPAVSLPILPIQLFACGLNQQGRMVPGLGLRSDEVGPQDVLGFGFW